MYRYNKLSDSKGFSKRRYKQNLNITQVSDSEYHVISYTTKVAIIRGNYIEVLGHWSKTTTKHINYVTNFFGLVPFDSKDYKKQTI